LGAVEVIVAATKGTFLIPLVPLGYVYLIQRYFRKTLTESTVLQTPRSLLISLKRPPARRLFVRMENRILSSIFWKPKHIQYVGSIDNPMAWTSQYSHGCICWRSCCRDSVL